MIDFKEVWRPQILAYARLIYTGQLEGEWLGHARVATSITDPDELHEQVFDDLDTDSIWPGIRDAGRLPSPAAEAIDRFVSALRDIDGNDPAVVVLSSAWERVRVAAGEVLATVC